MNLIKPELLYVVGDAFFFPSMAVTSIIGIFIGAVIYYGNFKELKKMIISLFCYASLIATVTLTRSIPHLAETEFKHPFSGAMTILFVSAFYLLGTFIGVKVTKFAHPKKIL